MNRRQLARWRLNIILYTFGLAGCPECHLRKQHRWSCDYLFRARDGRNWR